MHIQPTSLSRFNGAAQSTLVLPLPAVDRRFGRAAAGARPLAASRLLMVAIISLVAIAFRVYVPDYGGFSEDEVNKLNAIRAYEHGAFSANAEHPMVMKTMIFASVRLAHAWNRAAADHGWGVLSDEAALRLPNAVAGGLTTVPLYLLTETFFGAPTATVAALFWAFDVNATGINRIGKEDTFLVLFLLLGAWAYERARRLHLVKAPEARHWDAASGAAFGLMLASKYMPHYLGIWAVYAVASGVGRPETRLSRRFYLALALAFLAANPAVLLPSTWQYVLAYVHGATMTHHGSFFGHQLFPNTVDVTPWGLPASFYLVYLATKVPVPVLVAVLVGVAELVRRRNERGAVFARVFLVLVLLPYSLVGAKFARYLLPALAVLDIVAAMGVARLLASARRLDLWWGWRTVSGALAALALVAALGAQVTAAPYYSVYQNAIGARIAPTGYYFPNDEIYDIGMREAVAYVARRARPGAVILSDAPGVVGEYAGRSNRPDLQSRSLSRSPLPPRTVETWVLAQDSHTYFENQASLLAIRGRQRPDYRFEIRGATAVEVFKLPW